MSNPRDKKYQVKSNSSWIKSVQSNKLD